MMLGHLKYFQLFTITKLFFPCGTRTRTLGRRAIAPGREHEEEDARDARPEGIQPGREDGQERESEAGGLNAGPRRRRISS